MGTLKGTPVMNANPREALTCMQIGDKPVVPFEKHHFAQLPWQDWRSVLPVTPKLLSLHTHTNSMVAFRGFASTATLGQQPVAMETMKHRLACFVETYPASVEDAVRDLRYDEHIETETIGGVIRIQLPAQIAAPPFSYSVPKNRILISEDIGAWFSDEDAEGKRRKWRDSLLESFFLNGWLALVDRICRSADMLCLFEQPFSLDVDLDVFNTRRPIAPANTEVFYDAPGGRDYDRPGARVRGVLPIGGRETHGGMAGGSAVGLLKDGT
jgi:hypothetical protein